MTDKSQNEWRESEHVGTAPQYSTDPITCFFHGASHRVGTRYFYEKDYPDCLFEAGFRMRPKYKKFLETQSDR